jgi:Holliday junction resolvase RusA-like endonuclease
VDLVKKSVSFEVALKPGHLKANHAWRHTSKGGRLVVHKRPEYRAAQAQVRRAARAAAAGWQLEGPLHVHVTTFADRVHRQGAAEGLAFIDVDACVKGILDAVEHAGIIETDAQVSLLTACKAHDKESPGIAVHIAEIDEVDAAALSQLLNKVTGGE